MPNSPIPLPLDAKQIQAALPAAARARLGPIEVVREAVSTNDILAAGAASRDRAQIALRQTEGRGRQGRRWNTVDGALCFSVLHACTGGAPPALTLWIGIALVGRLRELGLGSPCLHWPNDLMYEDAKFGGILVECRARGNAADCVVGVGVNVEQAPELERPSTCIAQACGQSPEPNRLAAGLIDAVSECLAQMDAGTLVGLGAYFECCDGLRGKKVDITGPGGETCTGFARGVDDQGRLQVEGEEGVRSFDSAEARLRLA